MLVAYKRNKGKFVVVRANFAHNHGVKTPMGYVPKEDVVAYLTNTPPAIRDEGNEGMDTHEDDDDEVSTAAEGGPSEIFCTVEVGGSDAEQGDDGNSDEEDSDDESGVGGSSKGKGAKSDNGSMDRRAALTAANAGKQPKTGKKGVKIKGGQKLAPIKISGKMKEGLEKSAKSRRLQKLPVKYQKEENVISIVSTSKDNHDSSSSPVRVPFYDMPREVVTISARDPDEEELGLVSERCSMNPIDPEKAEILGTAVEALTAHLKQTEQWTGTDDWYFKNLLARLNLPLTSCWVD
jgi:hypothetical protein